MPLLVQGYPNVTLFAAMPYGNMTTACTADFWGTKLSFYTNQSTDYTLTFSDQTGDVLWLRDTKTNKEFAMLPSTTYRFSIDADQVSSRVGDVVDQKMVENRFVIVAPSAPLPTEYEICYRNGYLQISNYPADADAAIVLSDENGVEVKTLTITNRLYQEFNLADLAKGHYTFVANGKTLTIGVQ